MGMIYFVIAAIIIALFVIGRFTSGSSNSKSSVYVDRDQYEKEMAGREGEQIATYWIEELLAKGDQLFTNVTISYDGQDAELDNVIVNRYGLFIIEVKNYVGRIYGEEDDYEWEKYKDDGYGNTFFKTVRNPIRQVKRETYILANYLRQNCVDAWVNGYVFFIHENSPIESEYILNTTEDIEYAIHSANGPMLSLDTINQIKYLLSEYIDEVN